MPSIRLSAAFVFSIGFSLPALSAPSPALQQGEYLVRIAGCISCHTDEKNHGSPLAGGRALRTPFGIFYTPNITPDPETGIGRWSEADFRRALHEGLSPSGLHYYPAFPYTAYTQLRAEDVNAMWRYLQSRKAVHQLNKPHELPWYLRVRAIIGAWKAMYFRPGYFTPQTDQSTEWNRGAYLVRAAAHCGECHTPRNWLGGLKASHELSGNPEGVDGAQVPNITVDEETGIGEWTKNDLVTYLENGMTPDGDFAGDAMAEVIDNSTSHMTATDRRAIAQYIWSRSTLVTVRHDHSHHAEGSKPHSHTKDHQSGQKKKEPWE